jgi:hypothetical protein
MSPSGVVAGDPFEDGQTLALSPAAEAFRV